MVVRPRPSSCPASVPLPSFVAAVGSVPRASWSSAALLPAPRRARREALAAHAWPGPAASTSGALRPVLCLVGVALLLPVLVVSVLAAGQARYWDDPTERGVVVAAEPTAVPAAGGCRPVVLTVAVLDVRPGYPTTARHPDCARRHGVGERVWLRRDADDRAEAVLDPVPLSEAGALAALAGVTVLLVGGVALVAAALVDVRDDRQRGSVARPPLAPVAMMAR